MEYPYMEFTNNLDYLETHSLALLQDTQFYG